MRKPASLITAALAATVLLGAATPALARQNRTPARAEAIRNQIDALERDVNRNDNRDRISEREAAGLRDDVRDLKATFRSYNVNGLDNGEMRTLEGRLQNIRARMHRERNDGDRYRN